MALLFNFSLLFSNIIVSPVHASELTAIDSCHCVAFRLDDIQDYFLTNPQIEIMSTFEQRNISLTVGIVGNYFGEDPMIVNYVKSRIGDPLFEVANHGWNHEDFATFSRVEQSTLIQKTNEKIMQTLNIRPKVFIPPYNNLNNDTIAVLLENDFQVLSANMTLYPPSVLSNNQNITSYSILHFSSDALTGDLNDDDTEWVGYSHEVTLAAVEASISRVGYAVITMHPMEFALRNDLTYQNEINREQFNELDQLIDDLGAAGFRIVTISQIGNSFITTPEFSMYQVASILVVTIAATIWISNRANLKWQS